MPIEAVMNQLNNSLNDYNLLVYVLHANTLFHEWQ